MPDPKTGHIQCRNHTLLLDSSPHTGCMKIAKFRLKPANHLRRLATDFSSKEVQP
jgi:hypothetical protein